MKLFVPLVLLTASVAEAQFDALFGLANTIGILKPLECALPCVFESANDLKCGKDGPGDCICKNIDKVTEDTASCTEKCKASLARDFVIEVAEYLCGNGQEDEGSGSSVTGSGSSAGGGLGGLGGLAGGFLNALPKRGLEN